ncbi:MAG: tetratricopeptide repeat protein [Acidobacteriota bacterium]
MSVVRVVVLCAGLLLPVTVAVATDATMARGAIQVTPWKSQSPQKPVPPPATGEPDREPEAEPNETDDWRELGTRDPLLEKRARKNIEVAEFYARQKNFRASINRLTEIYEVYPQFTRFDRILLLLGKYHVGQCRLLEDEARRLQKQGQSDEVQRKADEARTHEAEARRYFSELLERFPESDLVKDARRELERLPH